MRFLLCAALLPLAVGCDHHYDDEDDIIWYVDAAFGSDFGGDGSPSYPFRTITFALEHARGGDLILVAPGTYSTAIGETFPIHTKTDVTIEGDAGARGSGTPATLISGGASENGIHSAVRIDGGSILRGFVVTNSGGVGVVIDNTDGTLEFCTVTGNGSDGVRLVNGASGTIQNNTITSNAGSGIVAFNTANPLIRTNSILNNTVDGVVANDTSAPSLSGGGNVLQGNGGVGLNNNTTATTIQAAGNTWRLSTQGSTASGTYPTALQPGPVAAAAANNFAITNGAAAIQF